MIDLSDVPARPQRQDSLTAQIDDLLCAAVRLGMYDAADWLRTQYGKALIDGRV